MADTFDIEGLPECSGLTLEDVLHVQTGTAGSRLDQYIKYKNLKATPNGIYGNLLASTIPASSTRYLHPGIYATLETTIANVEQFVIGSLMHIWAFAVRMDGNMGGDKLEFFLRKNDATDYLMLSRSSGFGSGWNFNTLSGYGINLVQQDRWAVKAVNSYTGATPAIRGWALYFK